MKDNHLELDNALDENLLQDYTKTKKMIEAASNINAQLTIDVQSLFTVGSTYSRKELKEKLSVLYTKYKVKRKANHNDMFTWFKKNKKKKGYDYIEILSLK